MSGPRRGRVEFRTGRHRLRIDLDAASVFVDDAEVRLTPTQYRILVCLAMRAGTIVPAREIIAEVWGDWYGPVDHVFVYIHHIRDRLGPCGRLIRTRRTMGYILQGDLAPDDEAASGGDRPMTYRLRLGAGPRVESVAPDGHFFGHRAEALTGATLPIDGLDVEAIDRFIASLGKASLEIFTGPHAVEDANGGRVPVHAALCLTLSREATIECVVEITVDGGHAPASSASAQQAGLAQAEPGEWQ